MYVLATYLSIGMWAVDQYRPCSTYVSSLDDARPRGPRSRPAVEVGNGLGEVLLEVAGEARARPARRPARDGARLTEVWNRRTCDEVAGQLLDLDEEAGGLAGAGAPPTILTLTSAHSPSREVADARARRPWSVENRTRS